MSYTTHYDIPYSDGPADSRRALDLYLPPESSADSPLLVFIHGGAWRSESKEDLRSTLIPSLIAQTNLPLAVVEYRLAPTYAHPTQMLDVLSALSVLTSSSLLPLETQHGGQKWDRASLHLIGHSAGAFIAASLVLSPPKLSSTPPSFGVPTTIREAISSIVCVDGIYDLPVLLEEYPSYSYFVDPAFGTSEATLIAESPARWELASSRREGKATKILVLHSREDELLTLRQSEVFVERLREVLGKEFERDVVVDFETVKGKHGELLERGELPKRVGEWVGGKQLVA
ncbi:kynurenine formamidase [Pseudohyphozyma bogoriensis]|nr:kynurenine formamidase [Pseudohyphozyma bogoriensis]